jgi:hypothetical protein
LLVKCITLAMVFLKILKRFYFLFFFFNKFVNCIHLNVKGSRDCLDWLYLSLCTDINTYESLRIEWDYDILLSICFELISVSSLRWKILLCGVVHCGSILKKK